VLQTVLDGREGVMPPWGTILEGMGGPAATDYVIAYVRASATPVATTCESVISRCARQDSYAGVCVACHGKDGKGNQALGAPDLTDDYWLYGDTRARRCAKASPMAAMA
jgi:cytochrome c oxidase cbb3-type subunit 3